MSGPWQKYLESKAYESQPIDVDAESLADWLVDNGLAEEHRGYGHADGEEVAKKLLDRFEIKWRGGPPA